jgi:exodeoxyribonuclease VII large subunit
MSLDNALPQVWSVSALNKAIADSLKARFSMVTVQAELSGFTRASSGHCYFNLKDSGAQIRCALFRRTAEQLNFVPRDGQLVQAQARVAVYEPRGEMQLVVEALRPAGLGQLHEAFLQLKAKLEAQGLFAQDRKRVIPMYPRAIGVVTSLAAAALHDVVTALTDLDKTHNWDGLEEELEENQDLSSEDSNDLPADDEDVASVSSSDDGPNLKVKHFIEIEGQIWR